MPLNPILSTILAAAAEADAPPMHEGTPEAGRAMYRAMNAEYTRDVVTQVSDQDADGVPVRVYNPNPEQASPALVYFHGGGWVIGDLETHDHICRKLANAAACIVIAVDYRLAPEHPFPAPLDDCYTALKWVTKQADRLGILPGQIAVGGDSAGGNLSAAVSLKARDENGPAICHQLLMYPVTDARFDTPSYADNAEGYLLTRDGMQWFWHHYIGDDVDPVQGYVSPLRATNLSNLPPATVVTAEFDPLRDEGESFARLLEEAGNSVSLQRYDGMVHGFFAMADLLEEAQDAFELSAKALAKSFGVTKKHP